VEDNLSMFYNVYKKINKNKIGIFFLAIFSLPSHFGGGETAAQDRETGGPGPVLPLYNHRPLTSLPAPSAQCWGQGWTAASQSPAAGAGGPVSGPADARQPTLLSASSRSVLQLL
jgi:hypothetical protein